MNKACTKKGRLRIVALAMVFVLAMMITTQNISAATEKHYADGTFYGTGEGFHSTGNSVAVTIKNGKITSIVSTRFGDDLPYKKGENILNFVKAQNGAEGIMETLGTGAGNGNGPAYDAVGGATFTAMGYLKAAQEALALSIHTYETGEEQTIKELRFKTSPPTLIEAGDALKLSDVVLEAEMINGQKKLISYGELAANGFSCSHTHGQIINPDFPSGENYIDIPVVFTHDKTGKKISTEVQVKKAFSYLEANRAVLTFDDQSTKEVIIPKDEFVVNVDIHKNQSHTVSNVKVYYDKNTEAIVTRQTQMDNNIFVELKSPEEAFFKFENFRFVLNITDGVDSNVDTDGDGVPDVIEIGADPNKPNDIDFDGIPDYKDPATTGEKFTIVDKNTGVTATILKGTFDKKIEFVGKKVDKEKEGYTLDAYDLTFMNNGEKVKPAKPITITLPLGKMDKENLEVFHESENHVWEKVSHRIDGEKVLFDADNFSVYALANSSKISPTGNVSGESKITKTHSSKDIIKSNKSVNTGDASTASSLIIGLLALIALMATIIVQRNFKK